MTEQQTVANDQLQTAKRQIHDQLQTAENTAQDMLRAWSDMAWATTEMSFVIVEKSLHYNNELFNQVNHTMRDGAEIWLRMYRDGLNTWQNNLQGIADVTSQITREVTTSATGSPSRSR